MRIKHLPYLIFTVCYFLFLISCKSINTEKKEVNMQDAYVVFSFDDGPDVDTTPLLLDILAKHEIKALFCLLGTNAQHYPELVKRIYDEGHIFVNHGFHDKWASKMNNEEFRDNLIHGEEAIKDALGYYPHPKLYRPHGGYYKSKQNKIFINEGYTLIPATIRVYDAVSNSSERRKVVKETVNITIKKNGGIILLHDAREGYIRKEEKLGKKPESSFNRLWIVQTVDEIITALLNEGFILHHPDILNAIGIEAD